MNFLLFLAPFSWGTQKRVAAAPKASGCFMGGTCVLLGRNRESRSREAAGRRNWPEAVPKKMRGRKRSETLLSEIREEARARVSQGSRGTVDCDSRLRWLRRRN